MANIIKTVIKKTLQQQHIVHILKAHTLVSESLLKNIEAEKGRLNPKIKKLSKEYARDILGNKCHAGWLNVYSAIVEEFKEGWIPDSYYDLTVKPCITGPYLEIDNKMLSSKLLQTDCLPDVVYCLNGLFYSPTWTVLSDEIVENYIFIYSDTVVFKKDISMQGLGVYIFNRKMFDIEEIRKMGNGVIQSYINQHDFFEEFMPHSVATLRLTSVIEHDGKASCRAGYLRIGRKDDTNVMSRTAVKIPVEIKSGRLSEKGYFANWQSTNCHPDTKIIFKGKIIPKFDKCVEFVKNTHLKIPFCRSVGWDISINKNDEIQLMEWNGGHNDIKFSEATQGPCFADMGWENLWKEQT